MKQIFQNPKTGKTRIEEIPSPHLKKGGVLVRNAFSVISAGTERGIIELSKKSIFQKAKERPDYVQKFFMLMKTKGIGAAWRVAQSKLDTDIALGYSTAGEVVQVANDVEEFRVGDRVACAGQNYASHAEYIFVPKNLTVRVPKNVSLKDASFVTLGAIAMQGIRQAGLKNGEKVAVIGLGLLGQLAVRMLKAYGHPVIGFDINENQVRFAKENGMDEGVVLGSNNFMNVVDKFTNGYGADAVLIYASTKTDSPLKIAVQVSREKGRIVQIGNILTNIPWRDFYTKELSYISSRSYGPGRYDRGYEEEGHDYPYGHVRWTEKRNMEEFLRLLNEKEISVENLVSDTFDIADAEKAYNQVFKPKKLTHGIILSYPRNAETSATISLPKIGEESHGTEGKDTIRIGLIGLGSFMNSTILPHLKEIKNAGLIAICHSQGLPAKKLGTLKNAKYVTSDYKKILDDKDIDLVICATRHSSHARIAKEALKAGKNLYIEKPLAVNEEELKEVIEAAKISKGKLFVGFNRRFTRHLLDAREEFKSSPTPLMILYRVNVGPLEKNHWSYEAKEGGRIIGEGIHFVDTLCFLTGSLPKYVSVQGIPTSGAIMHEENFSLNIEFENGSLGTVLYSALGNFRVPKEYLEIYGDGKVMIIDNFKSGKIVYPGKTKKIDIWHQDKGYTRELESFIDAIRKGMPSPITLHELFISHYTTFKAAESLKIGKPVELKWK